jgi:hypothetical protein
MWLATQATNMRCCIIPWWTVRYTMSNIQPKPRFPDDSWIVLSHSIQDLIIVSVAEGTTESVHDLADSEIRADAIATQLSV